MSTKTAFFRKKSSERRLHRGKGKISRGKKKRTESKESYKGKGVRGFSLGWLSGLSGGVYSQPEVSKRRHLRKKKSGARGSGGKNPDEMKGVVTKEDPPAIFS